MPDTDVTNSPRCWFSPRRSDSDSVSFLNRAARCTRPSATSHKHTAGPLKPSAHSAYLTFAACRLKRRTRSVRDPPSQPQPPPPTPPSLFATDRKQLLQIIPIPAWMASTSSVCRVGGQGRLRPVRMPPRDAAVSSAASLSDSATESSKSSAFAFPPSF